MNISWMILAMTLAAFGSIFAKQLTVDMHVIQALWLRLVLGCLFIFPMYFYATKRVLPGFGKLHFLRAFILIGMTGLWFYALKIGPIAQAAALSYTYPVFVLLLAALFFKERIQKLDLASIVLSFVGVVFVFQMSWANGTFDRMDALQLVVVLASSILIAIRISVEKVMTFDVSPEDILLGSMLISAAVLTPFVWPVWTPLDLTQMGWAIALTIVATLAQLFVIRLVEKEAWSIVSIFAFWEVLAAIGLGVVIFGESLSALATVGAGLIVVGGVLQFKRK